MDMTPPQAPPAIVQNEAQPAIEAFRALNATQQWLSEDRLDLPAAADALASPQRQAFLDALTHYWEGIARGDTLPRKQAWADRLASTLRDMANLRELDGTLPAAAARLARQVAATRANTIPDTLLIGEVLVGETVYAGALIAADHELPGVVLLFTPDDGWQAAASLDDAHSLLETRLRRAHAAAIDVPGITRHQLLDAMGTGFVSSRPLHDTDVFEALVTQGMSRQKEQLAEAWLTHTASIADTHRDESLVDAVDTILHGGMLFDLDAMLSVRDALLMEAVQAERLANVPEDVREDWTQAWNDYRASLQLLADTTDTAEIAAPGEYAIEQLRKALSQHGVTVAPDDILVTIDRSADPAARLESLQALFEGPAPAQVRLVDLAWQNIAVFSPVRLSATDAQGQAITALDDSSLFAVIRDTDLATRYQRYLTDALRDGDNAGQRKARAVAMQAAWMRMQANEARLSYYLPDEPRSLRFDHAERGFRWIEAVLDSPSAADRRKVEKHDIVVRQITLRDATLADVFEIGVASVDSVPTIILYTPDAPDGITWREFDNRGDAARRFFYNPAFREYLLDRLPASFAVTGPNRGQRRFDVDSRDWVFSDSEATEYTATGGRFGEADVQGNFLDTRYEGRLDLALRDVNTYSRSASEANWEWLIDRSMFIEKTATRLVKEAILAPFRAPAAAWRLYDSIKAQDTAQAFVDFTELYTHSLALYPYHALGRLPSAGTAALPVGAAARNAHFRAGRTITTRSSPDARALPFDNRYLARKVAREGQADSRGIYTVRGQQYIEHGGNMYAARWDFSFDTVRLRPAGASNTAYGPAVARTANGHWTTRSVGLKGGGDRQPVLRAGEASGAPRPATQPLDAWQQFAFRRNLDLELHTRMPNATSRRDLLRVVEEDALMGRTSTLSPQQAHIWDDAVRAAHETVTHPTPVIPSMPLRPVDLSRSSLPAAPIAQVAAERVPAGYRVVAPADIPAELFFTDRMPYSRSGFQRALEHTQRAGKPYRNDQATFQLSTQSPGVSGVRLSTAGPEASFAEVYRGTDVIPTSKTFHVRLNMQRLAPRLSGPAADLQLLRIEGAGGTSYVLRPLNGRPISLWSDVFSPPERWSGT